MRGLLPAAAGLLLATASVRAQPASLAATQPKGHEHGHVAALPTGARGASGAHGVAPGVAASFKVAGLPHYPRAVASNAGPTAHTLKLSGAPTSWWKTRCRCHQRRRYRPGLRRGARS